MIDMFCYVPFTDDDWAREVQGFPQNYEFPCVGAWDGFHIYISSKLTFFSALKRGTQ